MGDKHRSEIQKPVKNTLLSGASHGFPFENFQGSSLLIPVSQDSPSVLNDSAGDSNKLNSKELSSSDKGIQLGEAVSTTSLEGLHNPNESKFPTSSQGYAGIFSSFFGGGGGSQKKQEPDSGQSQPQFSDPATLSSQPPLSSFGTIQSFSPALQVLEPPQNDASTGNYLPTTSQSQGQSQSSFQTPPALSENPSVPSIFNTPDQSQSQNFFNQNIASGPSLGFTSQNLTSPLGFESFGNAPMETKQPAAALTKTQSAVDLVSGGSADAHLGNPPIMNSFQPNIVSSPQFYQTRTGSVDSINPVLQPPFGVSGSSLPASTPLAAPPMSSGLTSRNYRRDHHKRLAYAPVPGLTSNTAVSSSYLQPRDNQPLISTPTSLSSPTLTPPGETVRQPLPGSLSQPELNISRMSSGSEILANTSYTSSSSLQNFFNTPSGVLMTKSGSSNVDYFVNPTAASSIDSNIDSDSQSASTQSLSSSITFNNHNFATSNVTPTAPPTVVNTTYVATFHSVHPPIMSTREHSVTVSPPSTSARSPSPAIIPQSLNNLANLGTSGVIYRPVYHHWFIKMETRDSKEIWQPFSMNDSLNLEQAFNSDDLTPETIIATDGGRYDVNVTARTRHAVYWEEEPKEVRRCSWFYKSTTESRLHPYDENTAFNLEEEYKKAVTTNTWSRKVDLPTGDYIIMYGPSSMALFQSTPQTPEGWEAEPDYTQAAQHRPKIIKRGVLDDFDIDEGESAAVDHLIFVVHGIGSVCDFKFRTIEEAGDAFDEFLPVNFKRVKVDGFRAKSLQLIKSHFRGSVEEGLVNRVEILPVSWHNQLHGETTGVDKKLQTITLKSIPRLRHFTNDTLLDILFYTSPVYCQNIVHQVGREVNTLFVKFKTRNPGFNGGVSLVGHSLGSLILFDMLCHQKPPSPRMDNIEEESKKNIIQQDITTVVSSDKKKRSLSRNVSYVIGNAGTGQPFIEYPQLAFQPLAFFALGSPIGMFVTVRGIDSLGLDFCLPTCSRFFNIFHPFDPVAYRIEALVNPELAEKRPVLIPHHKGRKRMHLELKETMARVGADLKQRLVDSVRSTWNTVYQLTMFGRADDGLEQEVHQVIEKQLERQRTESVGNGGMESEETDFNAGRLNQGRRIDYVLQEAPLESFNEYVSAITSHVIYWDSEDTMLLILKEIYGSLGISSDNQQSAIPGAQDSAGPISPTLEPGTSSGNSASRQASAYGFK